MIIVATGTPPTRAKNGIFSGQYVIASSLPPERLRSNDDRWNAARSCQYSKYAAYFWQKIWAQLKFEPLLYYFES